MRAPIVTILTLLAVAAAAQEMTPVARPQDAPVTVGEFMKQFHPRPRHAQRRMRVAPNVIYGETADVSFVIPAAGNLAGANGTYFRSDLSIGNFANRDQLIGVAWLAANTDNTNENFLYYTIPANTIVAVQDYVGQTLKRSGLGAILVYAFVSNGVTDDNALIDGFSRIWTPQQGVANSTVSQSFPAIAIGDSVGPATAFALGLRQDANFRTNVGIVNLDSRTHVFTVEAITGVSTTVSVPPFSLGQVGAPAGSGNASGAVSLLITPNDDLVYAWSAYASSVDNVSGDGWVSRATQ